MSRKTVVVALPAKDEAQRIDACLRALAGQNNAARLIILVLVNNSSDDSAAIARAFARTASCEIVVDEIMLAEPHASAGGARRIAMHRAADLAGADGIVLTTDADGQVTPGWLDANLRAIADGADAVAGRALIDPADEALIPQALIDADAQECDYAALIDRINTCIDPDPADPWPRHDEHSGASIAVTVDAFRRAGGIPDMALGEDRAFFRSLRRIDARIRHAPDVQVVVSGRIEGRARGGMADTIRRRLSCPDMFLDERLERLETAVLRARLRRWTRLLWAEGPPPLWDLHALSRRLELPSAFVREQLAARHFGAAWDDLEHASPALHLRPVAVADVDAQIAAAVLVLADVSVPQGQAIGLGHQALVSPGAKASIG